jgi:hypothetical protein
LLGIRRGNGQRAYEKGCAQNGYLGGHYILRLDSNQNSKAFLPRISQMNTD